MRTLPGERLTREARDEFSRQARSYSRTEQLAKEDRWKIIAALQVSLDGLIEGPNGEVDWIGSWGDSFDVLSEIDTCVLGAGMYPGYEEYWLGVYEQPNATQPLTGQKPSASEVEYARFAQHVPHIVLSSTLATAKLPSTRFVRDVSEIRALKEQPGKHIHAVGGAKLVSSLMNAGVSIGSLRAGRWATRWGPPSMSIVTREM